MPRKKQTEPVVTPTIDVGADCIVDSGDVQAVAEIPASGRVVVFVLGEQLYALPIEAVQEIQQIVELTPVPDLAPALVGMVDIRGHVVPAIDLRVLIGLPSRDFTLETPMIFCRTHGRLVALIVDQVEDVIELAVGTLQPPSKLYALGDRMIGICRLGESLVIVLDPDKLIPDAALVAVAAQDGEVVL